MAHCCPHQGDDLQNISLKATKCCVTFLEIDACNPSWIVLFCLFILSLEPPGDQAANYIPVCVTSLVILSVSPILWAGWLHLIVICFICVHIQIFSLISSWPSKTILKLGSFYLVAIIFDWNLLQSYIFFLLNNGEFGKSWINK